MEIGLLLGTQKYGEMGLHKWSMLLERKENDVGMVTGHIESEVYGSLDVGQGIDHIFVQESSTGPNVVQTNS